MFSQLLGSALKELHAKLIGSVHDVDNLLQLWPVQDLRVLAEAMGSLLVLDGGYLSPPSVGSRVYVDASFHHSWAEYSFAAATVDTTAPSDSIPAVVVSAHDMSPFLEIVVEGGGKAVPTTAHFSHLRRAEYEVMSPSFYLPV